MPHWQQIDGGCAPKDFVVDTLHALIGLDGGIPYLGLQSIAMVSQELGITEAEWTRSPFVRQIKLPDGDLSWICTDGEAYVRYAESLGVYTHEEAEYILALLTLGIAGG